MVPGYLFFQDLLLPFKNDGGILSKQLELGWRLCVANPSVFPAKNIFILLLARGRSLGREDPLKKEMATHSSIHAWRIPWTEEPGRLQPMRSQRVGHDWATSFSLSLASPALAGEFILSTTTWKAQGMWDLSSLTRD